jgi:molybdopterin synthase catalytic subunit
MTAMKSLFFRQSPEARVTTGFVIVQEHDFDCSELQQALLAKDCSDGAVCSFVGFVRADKGGDDFQSMVLEHYEGMTQSSIERIIDQAGERWDIHCAGVVHRVGKLLPGEQIVWVGVASGHREAAFNACEYIMDYLKTDAPIWKKEIGERGEKWVAAKASDSVRRKHWSDD